MHKDIVRDIEFCCVYFKLPFNNAVPDSFIEEFKRLNDWKYCCMYFSLSEKFLRFFKDKIDWFYVSVFQDLSDDFINDFRDKLYVHCIPKLVSNEKTVKVKATVINQQVKETPKPKIKISEAFANGFKDS